MVSTEDCQSKGRGIESRSFSLLITSFSFIRLFDIIRLINTFHVANDLSTHSSDGSVERHARRDEEEGPAGVSGTVYGTRERMNWFVSKTIKWLTPIWNDMERIITCAATLCNMNAI